MSPFSRTPRFKILVYIDGFCESESSIFGYLMFSHLIFHCKFKIPAKNIFSVAGVKHAMREEDTSMLFFLIIDKLIAD